MHHPEFKFMISLFVSLAAGLAGLIPTDRAALAANNDDHSQNAWARVEMTRQQLLQWLGPVDSVDYGGFQWLPADSLPPGQRAGNGPAVPTTVVSQPFLLELGGESFDPIDRPINTLASTSGDDDRRQTEDNWWLVQFVGPSKRDWLADLAGRDLFPVTYVHPFTYVVWGSETAILQLQANMPAQVRAVSEFRASYKIAPSLRGGDELSETRVLMLLTANDELGYWHTGEFGRMGDPIRAISQINSFLSVIYLIATGIRAPDIATLPGVYAVQDVPLDTAARGELQNQVNVGQINTQGFAFPGYLRWLEGTGADGSGVTVGVVDEVGFRQDHVDLLDNTAPCVARMDGVSSCSRISGSSRHGTHVAGAIAGTGASGVADRDGFLRGLGVAPGASMVAQDFLPLLGEDHTGLVPEGMTTILREAARSGALLVNNSWGPSQTARGYDIPTQQVDYAVRDADPESEQREALLPVWAIMNGQGDDAAGPCAPGSLGSPDEAKNLLAVGATYLIDDAGEQVPHLMNDLAWVSGHGNACDGRRVPHLVAPGCNTDNPVDSTIDSHSHGGSGRPGFSRLQPGFCGTSMAAPNVTGAAAVFVEQHRSLHEATPSPALIKAALAGAASDLAGHRNANRSGANVMGHRPDRFQGFGRLDLDAAVNPPSQVLYFDQKHVFTDSGQAWSQRIGVDDPAQPVRVMLVWTDAPGHGLGGEVPAWVNDLDLRVGGPGQWYRGNVIGADGWSAGGGNADGINNMEAVYLSPEQHGGRDLDLSVLASNIAADALNPRNPDLTAPRQDFALVCYNCTTAVATLPGSTDLTLSFPGNTVPARAGQPLQVRLDARNLGPVPASDLLVTIDLPAGITHLRSNPSPALSSWSCSGARDTVRCRLEGGVQPGANVGAITLDLRVDESLASTVQWLTARISARRNSDPQPDNDLAQLILTVGDTSPIDAIFSSGFDADD